MPFFLLQHSHDAHECAAAFAAWQGFDSPLRHRRAPSTCLAGGHARVVAGGGLGPAGGARAAAPVR